MPDFLTASMIFRRGAEEVHLLLDRVVEQRRGRGVEWGAVVEQERCVRGETGDQPVPHHPAAGGEVEEPFARDEARLQLVLLEVLEQGAAGRMHDAFRHPRRPRREQDVERVGEGEAGELDRLGRVRRERCLERLRVGQPRRSLGRAAEIRDDDDRRRAGQPGRDLLKLVGVVDDLAGVIVAVGGDEQLRLDLAEAVERPARSEVGRGRGPHRADRGGGERRRDRLRQVGHQPCHPVALSDAEAAEGLLHARYEAAKLAPGKASPHLVLAAEDDSVTVIAPAEEVLGEIERRLREKPRAGHPVGIDETGSALIADDAGEVPEQVPERRRVLDRPGVQPVVAGEGPAAPLLRLARKAHHRQVVDSRRRPERLVVGSGQSLRSAGDGDGREIKKFLANPGISSYREAG